MCLQASGQSRAEYDRKGLGSAVALLFSVARYDDSLLFFLRCCARSGSSLSASIYRLRRGFSSSPENRASRSTSRVTMANRKLADNPHISTPMMPSSGPKVRHICGGRHRHSQRWHNCLPRSKRQVRRVENNASDRTPPKAESRIDARQ